ncbi:MAG: hypothetical protein M3Y58_15915 [Chloroflexota bacterium]|nr:hypothetical protein [Chloroflexota bacterium]
MRKRWILAFLAILLVGCGSGTTVVTVVVTNPPATVGINSAATATRAVELAQLATALAPTAPSVSTPKPTGDITGSSPPLPTAPADAAMPTSQMGSLHVVAQGYGQNERSVGYAFIVENADAKTAVDFSQFRVSAFDVAGAVLRTEARYIAVVFPGQRLGVAGELFLADNTRVARVDVTLTPGRARPFEGASPLSVDTVAFQGDPLSNGMITGVVKSAFPQELKNVAVSAIAYDAGGAIIGGGQMILDRVPANGQAASEVAVTVSGLPARVEMYPAISL